jgi:hypothetical protein
MYVYIHNVLYIYRRRSKEEKEKEEEEEEERRKIWIAWGGEERENSHGAERIKWPKR